MAIEDEIERAERLRAAGNFAAALPLHQELLRQVTDDQSQIRLLYGVVICATRLGLSAVMEDAMRALAFLPERSISRLFANFFRATTLVDMRQPQEALELITGNLRSDLLQLEEMRDARYEHVVCQGNCLSRLARHQEALESLESARKLQPEGKHKTLLAILRAQNLNAMSRFDEGYEAASEARMSEDADFATLALQHMAASRIGQQRFAEAVAIYLELQRKLPCPYIDEKALQDGLRRARTQAERESKSGTAVLKYLGA